MNSTFTKNSVLGIVRNVIDLYNLRLFVISTNHIEVIDRMVTCQMDMLHEDYGMGENEINALFDDQKILADALGGSFI